MLPKNGIARFHGNHHGSHTHHSPNKTGEMIESISSTVSGIQQINYVEEFDKTLSAEAKKTMKQFLIYRSNPGDPEDQPKFMSYWINLKECGPMYLDALIKIKDEYDPTLAFRR